MKISIIVAFAKNMVIGNNNHLPWKLSNDLQYFKKTTMKKPIIMGRKTFESIGKPLPGRVNIVLTQDKQYQAEGCICMNDLTSAIEIAKTFCPINDVDEIMIVGGAEIYRQSIEICDRIYATEILQDFDGDSFFPKICDEKFKLVKQGEVLVENNIEHIFNIYERYNG